MHIKIFCLFAKRDPKSNSGIMFYKKIDEPMPGLITVFPKGTPVIEFEPGFAQIWNGRNFSIQPVLFEDYTENQMKVLADRFVRIVKGYPKALIESEEELNKYIIEVCSIVDQSFSQQNT